MHPLRELRPIFRVWNFLMDLQTKLMFYFQIISSETVEKFNYGPSPPPSNLRKITKYWIDFTFHLPVHFLIISNLSTTVLHHCHNSLLFNLKPFISYTTHLPNTKHKQPLPLPLPIQKVTYIDSSSSYCETWWKGRKNVPSLIMFLFFSHLSHHPCLWLSLLSVFIKVCHIIHSRIHTNTGTK